MISPWACLSPPADTPSTHIIHLIAQRPATTNSAPLPAALGGGTAPHSPTTPSATHFLDEIPRGKDARISWGTAGPQVGWRKEGGEKGEGGWEEEREA